MCDIWQRKDSRILSVAGLERHRDSFESLRVRQVVLTGGEPLLNPELGDICNFLRSLNIKVTLLTTGLLLRNRAALVADGIDDIILSLDGPAEVHNAIRRIPRAFEVIAKGIEAVRLLRPSMPIACRTTVQKQNHTALCATVDASHALALDSISFLPADVSSQAFNRQEAWTDTRSDEVGLTGAEVVALEAEIEALIQSYQAEIRTGFIAENGVKLRRIARRFRERLEGTAPQAPMCNAPWVSAVMEVDGGVRPCFFHPSTASTQGSTLEQALNSPAAMSFRSHLDVATNPTCQRCVCSLNYRT
jgi:MoaA/NifB/PqqE/SkfB family radical SAM enzyme